MRVRIVCYEDVDAWILGKFAKNLHLHLSQMGVECDIAKNTDRTADINHHIMFLDYDGTKSSVDTLMITHVDSIQKLVMVKTQLKAAEMGICMSRETADRLRAAGCAENKVCYINPAHDGMIGPRKLVLGITSKTHEDGRKGENFVLRLCRAIPSSDFMFKIMGSGWDKIIDEVRAAGFTVDYFPRFDYRKYTELMPSLDYYIYLSYDEGSMGFIDALSAGVLPLVSPQGYHLDVGSDAIQSIPAYQDLESFLLTVARKRKKLTESVGSWTWANYAQKHLEVWQHLLGKRANTIPPEGTRKDGMAYLREEPKKANFAAQLNFYLLLAKSSIRYYFRLFTFRSFPLGIMPGTIYFLCRHFKRRLSSL